MAKKTQIKKESKQVGEVCSTSPKLWCLPIMAVLILIFLWIPGTWTKIVVTVLAAMILVRSMIFNCACK